MAARLIPAEQAHLRWRDGGADVNVSAEPWTGEGLHCLRLADGPYRHDAGASFDPATLTLDQLDANVLFNLHKALIHHRLDRDALHAAMCGVEDYAQVWGKDEDEASGRPGLRVVKG